MESRIIPGVNQPFWCPKNVLTWSLLTLPYRLRRSRTPLHSSFSFSLLLLILVQWLKGRNPKSTSHPLLTTYSTPFTNSVLREQDEGDSEIVLEYHFETRQCPVDSVNSLSPYIRLVFQRTNREGLLRLYGLWGSRPQNGVLDGDTPLPGMCQHT